MADCPSPFHRARQRRGAPMCGRLQVGRRLVGVLGVGGWRMSLEPINSSLTKHLGEISHALLDSCTENPLSGSPEMGIPYGHTGNTTQMNGIIWSMRRASWVRLSAVHGKCEQMNLLKYNGSTPMKRQASEVKIISHIYWMSQWAEMVLLRGFEKCLEPYH